MKKIVSILFLSLMLVSCGQNASTPKNTVSQNGETQATQTSEQVSEKISVTASIIPLASVIRAIGGDYVEVNTIVPAGVSPHGFDLSARQMMDIEKSEIVFMTGLEGIDDFLEKASAAEKQVHLADSMTLLDALAHSHEDEAMHIGEQQEDEHNHDKDPHVWLGKENIIQIAGKVRDEFSQILPEYAAYFAENTASFEAELSEIYTDFAEKTAGKSPREFIVFHDAFNYLVQSVGMDLSLKVPFSENVLQETGTAHMKELIEKIEIHGVKNVFREPQFSDGNLQKLASEYNLEVGILDPVGTDDSASGYLENLKNNLESLYTVYE